MKAVFECQMYTKFKLNFRTTIWFALMAKLYFSRHLSFPLTQMNMYSLKNNCKVIWLFNRGKMSIR